MYIYINIYSIDETTASQLDFLLNYIYICVCVEQNYLNFSCNNTFIVEIQRQTGRGNKKNEIGIPHEMNDFLTCFLL